MKALHASICLLVGILAAGCATTFEPLPAAGGNATPDPDLGARIARAALDVVGTPYRYGGNTTEGFDCSGLVQFVHASVGIDLPRTSTAQFRAGPGTDTLSAGDVVFFRIGGKVAHAGIYVGDGRFVHAPASGKQVSVSRTDNPYFEPRFAGARRFHQAAVLQLRD